MTGVTAPNKASTVLLVRPDANHGFEVFLTRRPERMEFLAGFYVFPGGSVGDNDCSEKMLVRCRGLSPSNAQQILGHETIPELSLGHWVAAVRELFEEAGVHLFVGEDGKAPGNGDSIEQRLAQKRKALVGGVLEFSDLLESEGLYCDLSQLAYLFQRITPEKYSVRYDTRFFLASLPKDQSPLDSSEEVAESLWIEPQAVLDQSESGKFPLMPPTIAALRTLASYGSWQKLCAAYGLR